MVFENRWEPVTGNAIHPPVGKLRSGVQNSSEVTAQPEQGKFGSYASALVQSLEDRQGAATLLIDRLRLPCHNATNLLLWWCIENACQTKSRLALNTTAACPWPLIRFVRSHLTTDH